MPDVPVAAAAPPGSVDLVGLHGGEPYGAGARAALASATVVFGSARHLGSARLPRSARRVPLDGTVAEMLEQVATARSAGERVAVLVSGDPNFFGLGRLARQRLGPVGTHPAPSSVALAFARAGTTWDDAVVVSAHGRAPDGAVETARRNPKVAVLCSPDSPPARLAVMLRDAGLRRDAVVASRIGEEEESVWFGDLESLAGADLDPMSVVVLSEPGGARSAATGAPNLVWGRPDDQFAHRDGMITKSEVRAVALGKLAMPAAGVMWDVGAGSGSVAAECAALRPALAVYAVERDPAAIATICANTRASQVRVVPGEAPAALEGLPDPDCAFVGGGGFEVLSAVWERMRPGATLVATYAAMSRASAAANLLGSLVQVSVARGVPSGPDGLRLAALNPVFVCWGTRAP